ncbi:MULTISPECIES: protease inhibitor I42 family protein [Mesotoga]|uniref:protease inhibitor I42 family protein n=1 Tax=Mesotoga TaxID=1184396 RepID=UPI001BD605C1|nr:MULTISPECIES: protease inhibitor I42 family protein [Mesotoga]MDD4208025.1 protease inhibitor I42 family protein [Mesotoga sp.]MDD5681996.1 protease inhibitor I42 family protein [Mesotoga sp.]HOP37491.1 protease inhibitor I42 family protein [Mesotoga prima]HPA00067.1 protease inhibitor I42 family protein [Mesotoga prima]HQN61400.1 protease inhibitor I42 family protein [Mesotoga prima]
MKKTLTAFFYIALIITLGLAIELKESANSMSVNDLAILEIQENPSTGYLWHIFAEPTGVLRNFLEEHNAPSMMPGAPSVKGWIMTAAKEGKALITLKLFRQWEGEKHSVDFRALTVDVAGQGKGQVDLKILMNEVTLGTTFTVTLEENASTGYTWQYVVLGDGITEKSKEISVDKSDKVGAPSKVTWTFQAVDEGYSTIIFRYFRSWEGKESAVDYKAYNISVK